MKKQLHGLVLFVIIIFSQSVNAGAQGCVAIRQMGGCNEASGSSLLGKGQWQVGTNYRYFRSHRHFKGDAEQTIRAVQGTEVVNNSHAWDATIAYGLTNRISLNLAIPFVYNERSSLYEHGGKARHTTFSGGLADVRLSGNYWLFDPVKHHNGNLQVGLGVKLPTGNPGATSRFYNADGTTYTKVVDQSIQPGDGGFGVSLELQGYRQIWKTISLYGSAFYMSNPREVNNTVLLSNPTTPAKSADGSILHMSVADQYLTRLGLNWATPVHGLMLSFGGRYEGVPSSDLIGGSKGFRRPGYVWSFEPGLAWYSGNMGFSLSVPVANKRGRPQSYEDKLKTQLTGTFANGDAAFADYSVNLSVVYRFGGQSSVPVMVPHFNDVKH
jgi:hypothetical protein